MRFVLSLCRRSGIGLGAALWIMLAASVLQAQNPSQPKYREIFVSPDVKSHQGYATDGTNHFTFDNKRIYKWDAAWSLINVNTNPFPARPFLNHFGDGDYYDGKLYLVAESWADCTNREHESILVFAAGSLARLEVHDVSAQDHEVSGLAVAPTEGSNGIIYVTSYCDGSKIFKYDLRTFAFLGTLPLNPPLSYLQGVAWHNGRFFVPEDGGAIYTFKGDGQASLIYQDPPRGSHEGLKRVGNDLRWLIDGGKGNQRVHFFVAAP